MHILLIRFSSMGDVVLQTATINWLRSLYGKNLQLSFVTSQEFISLIDTHPGLNNVISFNRRGGETWKDLIKKIDDLDEKQPIDLIMDMHATLRSFRLRMNFWTTPALTLDKRRWERFLLTKLKGVFFKRLISKKVFGLEPQVERIINDFESMFFETRGVRRTKDFVRGPHEEMTTLGALPEYKIDGDYVVLAPSASFVPKRWPIQSFVDLANNLLDKVCIGNDSGMNHIAEAHGVPCLTIFGPTDPRFGFAPHGSKSKYLSQELWCKPCSTTGSKACFRDKLYCMEDISVAKVYETYLSMGVSP